MDFKELHRRMVFQNITNRHVQNDQYQQDLLRRFIVNEPISKPIQPPMPFNSSHTNMDRYSYGGYQYNHLLGSGLAEDDAIRSILRRNADIRAQNEQELQNDESGQFDTEEQTDTSGQKQSLELYFNELQDGGFGGTDINRENTRKALFNLKAIGLDLNLTTLQRYEKIVNEFIDSFVLSVKNPQFSEIISNSSQDVQPAKRIEILKASLKNLDSIENVLRILKVLDALEETYNLQDIQREPTFEAQFNDIIEAKPTQYIPKELRALLTRANKTFDQLKDQMQGIQDIRGDIQDKPSRIKSDTPKLNDFYTRLVTGFEIQFTKSAKKIFDKVRENYSPRNQEGVFEHKLSQNKFNNDLKAFFKSVKVRDIISQNMSNYVLNQASRHALINLVNGEGDVNNNIKIVSKDFNTMLQDVYTTVKKKFIDQINPQNQQPAQPVQPVQPAQPAQPVQPVQPVQPAQPKPIPQTPKIQPKQAPIPDTTPTERKFFDEPELLKQIEENIIPILNVHHKSKITNVKPTTNLADAEAQQQEASTTLTDKKKKGRSKTVITQQKLALKNAKMIVKSIKKNNQYKKQTKQLDDVKQKIDFEQDGRAIPDDIQQQEQSIAQQQQEAEDIAKEQALAYAQEQLKRTQQEEEVEQKGQGRSTGIRGRRIPSRAYKTKGGKNKKESSIDQEHRSRLRALLM